MSAIRNHERARPARGAVVGVEGVGAAAAAAAAAATAAHVAAPVQEEEDDGLWSESELSDSDSDLSGDDYTVEGQGGFGADDDKFVDALEEYRKKIMEKALKNKVAIRVDDGKAAGKLFYRCFRRLSDAGQGKMNRKAALKRKVFHHSSKLSAKYSRHLFLRKMDLNMWCADDFGGKWFLFRTPDRKGGKPFAIVRAVTLKMDDETSADEADKTSTVKA